MIVDKFPQVFAKETPLEQMAVFAYETGDMAKMFFYAKVYKEPAYLIEGKISLSDLLAQAVILCERQGWDFDQVKQMGVDRAIERIQRRLEKGE